MDDVGPWIFLVGIFLVLLLGAGVIGHTIGEHVGQDYVADKWCIELGYDGGEYYYDDGDQDEVEEYLNCFEYQIEE